MPQKINPHPESHSWLYRVISLVQITFAATKHSPPCKSWGKINRPTSSPILPPPGPSHLLELIVPASKWMIRRELAWGYKTEKELGWVRIAVERPSANWNIVRSSCLSRLSDVLLVAIVHTILYSWSSGLAWECSATTHKFQNGHYQTWYT